MKTKQQGIDEVMDHFDFDYVFKCMMLDETFWIHRYEENPSVNHVKEFVLDGMEVAYERMCDSDSNRGCYWTGGFKIICKWQPEYGINFEVLFLGVSWVT